MIIAALAAPLLLLAAGAQQAPDPAATPAPASAPKPICRREVRTGSNLPGRRVCHSRAEWATIEAGNAANMEGALARRAGRGLSANSFDD